MSAAQLLGHVPSLTDPRTTYAIYEYNGAFSCECQAFASWQKRGLPCWHLRVWKAATGAMQRCEDVGHPAGAGRAALCRSCLLAVLAAMAGKVKRDYVPKAEAKADKATALGKLRERHRAAQARQKAKRRKK